MANESGIKRPDPHFCYCFCSAGSFLITGLSEKIFRIKIFSNIFKNKSFLQSLKKKEIMILGLIEIIFILSDAYFRKVSRFFLNPKTKWPGS